MHGLHFICYEHCCCALTAPAPAPPLSTQKLMCYVYVEVQTWRLSPSLGSHVTAARRLGRSGGS